MPDRFFTPTEVEALIPTLTEIMGDVMAAQADATTVRERLRAEQERIALAGGGLFDRDVWRQGREDLERLGATIRQRLEDIARLGGVAKDLGLGLVDFPHRRGNRLVHLCWKHGEHSIEYWHGLDEGYVNRKPL